MSLTLTPMPRCSSFRIWTRSGEASPLRTSGRSSGSMTRKLRAIRLSTPHDSETRLGLYQIVGYVHKFVVSAVGKARVVPANSSSTEAPMPTENSSPRRIVSLNGRWDFSFEGPTARLDGERHSIRIPGIWQTQFPELRNAQG